MDAPTTALYKRCLKLAAWIYHKALEGNEGSIVIYVCKGDVRGNWSMHVKGDDWERDVDGKGTR